MEALLEDIHEATRNINRRSGTVDRDINRIVEKSNELLRRIQSLDFSENTPATINAIRQKLQRIQQATRGKVEEPRLVRVNDLFGQLYNALSPNRPAPNRLTAAISRLASAATRAQATRTRLQASYQNNAWLNAPVTYNDAVANLYRINTRGGRRTRRRSKLYV
jgi:chromosome segregation ATPase